MPLPRRFFELAKARPDETFLWAEGHEVTRGALATVALKVAGFLESLPLATGTRIGAMLMNRPEFLAVWFGTNAAGMTLVPYNAALRGDDLDYQLRHSKTRILFVEAALLPHVSAVFDRIEDLTVVVVGGKAPPGMIPWEFVTTFDPGTISEELRDGEIMEIVYTSGTTSRPKGVVWRFGLMSLIAETLTRHLALGPEDRLMVVLPLFHGNAQLSTAMTIMCEGSMLLVPRFTVSRFWELAREGGATEVNFLGPLLTMLYNQPPAESDADNPIRVAFSAATPAPIHEAFERRFGLTVVEGYGLTETGINTANPLDPARRKVGSIGLALPYNEVAILGDDLAELPPGQPGEICVRPAALTDGLMQRIEYVDDPEATATLWRGGWLHTGDEGVMDEEGFFTFLDRKKDVIRRRGENIASQQVEHALLSHPKVGQAAVVGIPSDLGEEEVLALIVALEPVTPEELAAYCLERLAAFKVPEWYSFVEELPTTPTGRVKKALLKTRGDLADEAVKINVATIARTSP